MKVIEKKKTEYSTVIKNLQSLGNKDDVDAVNKIVEEYLRR
jgi:hypothetical protein